MKLYHATFSLVVAATASIGSAELPALPVNGRDYNEPDWMAIIDTAFPPWAIDGPCGSLDSVGGSIAIPMPNRSEDGGKWNPCYYTKRFAGLDPSYGGYPTPIDTRYPYEFASPFFGQPGYGSPHHCPADSAPNTNIASCPQVNTPCPDGDPNCVVRGEYGIGHIPPFVPLAAVKKEYLAALSSGKDICSQWFDYDFNRCDIKKEILDGLVVKYFGAENNTIRFSPPTLKEDGVPSDTYYSLEFPGRTGPHYCTDEVKLDGTIWDDFCPYVHTGDNSGKYRHPHIAFSALQQMIAHACMPTMCGTEWDEGPFGYPPNVTTSITWCEMEQNDDPLSQPAVPYTWPMVPTEEASLPGPYRYGSFKPVKGYFINELVLQGARPVLDVTDPSIFYVDSDSEGCNDAVSGSTSIMSFSFTFSLLTIIVTSVMTTLLL